MKEVFMKIDLIPQKPIKEKTKKMCQKAEDFLFAAFHKMPEKSIPPFIMQWMEKYTEKRLAELQSQLVKSRWTTAELEKAVQQIGTRQQDQ